MCMEIYDKTGPEQKISRKKAGPPKAPPTIAMTVAVTVTMDTVTVREIVTVKTESMR